MQGHDGLQPGSQICLCNVNFVYVVLYIYNMRVVGCGWLDVGSHSWLPWDITPCCALCVKSEQEVRIRCRTAVTTSVNDV